MWAENGGKMYRLSVSIIIDNYNYADYVGEAIECAKRNHLNLPMVK